MSSKLFPTHLPRLQWSEFTVEDFEEAVCGVVFRLGDCSRGMPLGGIGTGCVDLNVDGTLGLCSIFNSFAPPRDLRSPLLELNLPNFIVTPHVAWASDEAMQALADQLIDNLEAFVRGQPRNLLT